MSNYTYTHDDDGEDNDDDDDGDDEGQNDFTSVDEINASQYKLNSGINSGPPLEMMGAGAPTMMSGSRMNISSNTGPKGVLNDYREACRIARATRIRDKIARLRALEKLAVGNPVQYTTAQYQLHSNKPRQTSESDEEHHNEDDDDEDEDEEAALFADYQRQRIENTCAQLVSFGRVEELHKHTLIDCIDKVNPSTLVVVHLYKPDNEACMLLNDILKYVAAQFVMVHFCRLIVTKALPNYDSAGLPALIVYQGRKQIKSFLPLTEFVSQPFTNRAIVKFLHANNIVSGSALANSAGGLGSDISPGAES